MEENHVINDVGLVVWGYLDEMKKINFCVPSDSVLIGDEGNMLVDINAHVHPVSINENFVQLQGESNKVGSPLTFFRCENLNWFCHWKKFYQNPGCKLVRVHGAPWMRNAITISEAPLDKWMIIERVWLGTIRGEKEDGKKYMVHPYARVFDVKEKGAVLRKTQYSLRQDFCGIKRINKDLMVFTLPVLSCVSWMHFIKSKRIETLKQFVVRFAPF